MPDGTLVFDIESHDADLLYSMPTDEFVRLIGYRWVGTNTLLTTDVEELRDQIRSARWIIGHNLHAFDLKAVFGPYSNEPLELTDQGRVFDLWTHAPLVFPAPYRYTNRFGQTKIADKPDRLKQWFGLDELAYQLGVSGKTDDLSELAYEFGDPSLSKKARIRDGYGRIPVDDQRYRDYLAGDVEATEQVARALIKLGGVDTYALREQKIAARAAAIESNGVRLDRETAHRREQSLADRRNEILADLQERYGFPTEGKSPWATDAGKQAILSALAEHGITPESNPDWPLTPKGNLKLGGDDLIGLTKGTSAEELGKALAELKGQRSLSKLALDSVYPDGFIHPQVTMLQRSGRWSTTEPGLTIWDDSEKHYFIPDNEDEVLLEVDYSNADARIVAALSGDQKYALRFEEGADGHLINAQAAWGTEAVGTDKHDPVTAEYRQKAKPLGHGWSYGGRAKGLAKSTGYPLSVTQSFCDGMDATFHKLVAWQNKVRGQVRNHRVYNEWGRPMYVEPGREFTQVPALHGQSGTREIVCDALLRMPYHVLRRVKAQIHDALLFSVPEHNWEACRDYLVNIMETSFKPAKGGQRIEFPVSAGVGADNWHDACH